MLSSIVRGFVGHSETGAAALTDLRAKRALRRFGKAMVVEECLKVGKARTGGRPLMSRPANVARRNEIENSTLKTRRTALSTMSH